MHIAPVTLLLSLSLASCLASITWPCFPSFLLAIVLFLNLLVMLSSKPSLRGYHRMRRTGKRPASALSTVAGAWLASL